MEGYICDACGGHAGNSEAAETFWTLTPPKSGGRFGFARRHFCSPGCAAHYFRELAAGEDEDEPVTQEENSQ